MSPKPEVDIRGSTLSAIREARRRRSLHAQKPRNWIDIVAAALGSSALAVAFVLFFFATFVSEFDRYLLCGALLVFGIGAALVEQRTGGRVGRRVGVIMMVAPCATVLLISVW